DAGHGSHLANVAQDAQGDDAGAGGGVVTEDDAAQLALLLGAAGDVVSDLGVAALDDLHGEVGLVHQLVHLVQGDSGGAAVDVGDDVGLGGHDLLGGDGGGAGDGGAAGVHLDLHAVLVGPLDHGSGVLRLLHAAQADL